MTMFRALAPSLTVWAANPRALRVVLLDKDGQAQDLTGRTATLSIRRSAMLEPRVTVDSVISTDGYAWLFLLTAAQCDMLYADGQFYSISYDVIETRAGGSLRWTGRIDAQPASELPGGGAAPVLVDLPVAELISETDTVLISERGAAGFGVEQRLKDLGRIDEATPAAMDNYIRGLGEDAAAPYAATALDARDTALIAAGRSVDATQQAEAAAQAALLGSNIYADASAGAAATPDGEEFVAYGPEGSYATRYLMVSGAPVAQDSYPNRSALDAQAQAVQRVEQPKSPDRPMHSLESATMVVADIYEDGVDFPGLNINAEPRPYDPYEAGLSGFFTKSGFWPIAFDRKGWWLPGGARMETGPKGVQIIQRDGSIVLGGPDVPVAPIDITPICGGDLALVSDRPLPLHIPSLFKVRSDAEPAIVTIASRQTLPAKNTLVSAAGGTVMLDPARVGPATTLSIRLKGQRTTYLTRTMLSRVKQVPVSGSPVINLHSPGDSITARQLAFYLKLLLESWGFVVNFIGTMNGDGATSGTGPLGEGREGWAFQDWLGIEQDSDWTNVVPVGGEAAYLALPNADKLRWHPALNPDLNAGSQCPIVTVGGVQYRFDFAFYLSRFGYALPTDDMATGPKLNCIVVNLGMNDLLEKDPATSLAQVIAGYGYLLDEYRRVAPTAKIVVWASNLSNSVGMDAIWSEWAAILAAVGKIVRDRQAAGDPNIRLCSAWLHQSPEPGGWNFTASAVDAVTGFSTATWNNDVHPVGIGRDNQFEAVAAAVANFF
ncbi:hypothetical protein GS397_15050 [Sphingobium yanoikuyae]|uniref:Uncharacterized protein n=1 Tax=Sphingobium yanoikuyae TaxID=13690 RepID=A0A6P1GIK7_SPHYA|nr:hypothetical protein [Sphingobium yanoikuyae]QHD68230.1 hypothetical protein GS397_15050 [Sphingobium yanoikuyae]